MLPVILISLMGVYAIVVTHRTQRSMEPMSKNVHNRLQRLWQEAHKNIQNKQWLRAERALLTILKFDKKDASAYNRLGIIYAKQKDYDDAIKCFEIAKSIKPGASNYHNLGLLYLETENFEKAQVAFEEAIDFDPKSAMRYIALAKVFDRTDRRKNAIEALEKAVELDPSAKNYDLLAESYAADGDLENADQANQEAHKIKSVDTKKKSRIASRAKRGTKSRRLHRRETS